MLHELRHAPTGAKQAYGPQSNDVVASSGHVGSRVTQMPGPIPLERPVHWLGAHCAPARAATHSPFPLHVPRHVSLGPHSFRRSMPSGSTAQIPGEVGSAHEWQASVQAELQQSPSTQNPEAHSDASLHSFAPAGVVGAPPSSCGTATSMLASEDPTPPAPPPAPALPSAPAPPPAPSLPPSLPPSLATTHAVPAHAYPLAQSASAAQLVLHASVPHAYAPQLACVPVTHAPLPSHVEAVVALPFAQVPEPHVVLAPG